MPETLTLDDVSVLLVWTAIAVYALAMLAYAAETARRTAGVATVTVRTSREPGGRRRRV